MEQDLNPAKAGLKDDGRFFFTYGCAPVCTTKAASTLAVDYRNHLKNAAKNNNGVAWFPDNMINFQSSKSEQSIHLGEYLIPIGIKQEQQAETAKLSTKGSQKEASVEPKKKAAETPKTNAPMPEKAEAFNNLSKSTVNMILENAYVFV